MKLSQKNRQAVIATPLGADKLMLQSFAGAEGLSSDFEYKATVVSEDPSIDGKKIVGKPVSITYFSEDGGNRKFHGFVNRFEYLRQVEEPADLTAYELTIVPWLWFLKNNKDCRIFQEMKTITQIFKAMVAL